MNKRHRMIAPLLPIAACLIGGMVASLYVSISATWLLGALAVAIISTLLLHHRPRWQTAGIYFCNVGIGMLLAMRPALPTPQVLQRAEGHMLDYRTQLLDTYRQQGISDTDYAILAAMTMGDKSELTRDVREVYNTTGAGHILALSGLHLGILYMLISALTRGVRWRMMSQILTIIAIWAFAMLTGLSSSVVRSATMLTVYGLLSLGYRRGTSVNVLAFTAIVMLVVTPESLWDVGFQMSFLAMLGILLFFPLLYELIPPHYLQAHRGLRLLWSMTLLSLTAQAGVAPLIAFYFHHFSTYFLLSNFVVVPCAYVILLGASVLLVTGLAPVAVVLTHTIRSMNSALEWIAALPMASIDGLHPSVVQTELLYVLIACIYILFRIFLPDGQPTADSTPNAA